MHRTPIHKRHNCDPAREAGDKVPARKHVTKEDDAEEAENAESMGQEPPGRWKCVNQASIEHNRTESQGDGSQERQAIVRLAPEEEGRDQPVPQGIHTHNHDDVGRIEVE